MHKNDSSHLRIEPNLRTLWSSFKTEMTLVKSYIVCNDISGNVMAVIPTITISVKDELRTKHDDGILDIESIIPQWDVICKLLFWLFISASFNLEH